MISQYKIAILDLYGCQKTVTKSSLSITISVVTITEKDCTVLVFTKFSARHIPPHVRTTADGGDAGEDHDQSLSDRELSCVGLMTMSEILKINHAADRATI